ncbi:MAG TPA: glucose 1-dehydrogenase [Pelolinea sp.]|nr:glucose 1-dehydrogenase [Pelolinea sp.]
MIVEDVRNIFSLDGKTALVTGAGQGLGGAIAEGFAQFGADVAVVDINPETVESVSGDIRSMGRRSVGLQCDVSKEDEVKKTIDSVIKELGKIDILAAVAGIGDRAMAEEMTMDQWDRVMDINLRGLWMFDQAVGKHLINRKSPGSIVNMASIAGQVGVKTGNANYCASKGGVIALTRLLAVEWAKYNIRVNAIAPVQFKTPLIAGLLKNPETVDYFLSYIPMGRFGEVHEIVGPAVFLASEAASMVTGIVLNVDGGHTAM